MRLLMAGFVVFHLFLDFKGDPLWAFLLKMVRALLVLIVRPVSVMMRLYIIFILKTSWIEELAKEQLVQLSHMDGVEQVAAFPDLHPGKFGPVGVSILADRVYPQLIGNDIGCGMSLFVLDVEVRKLKLEKCAHKLRALECALELDVSSELEECGLLQLADTQDLYLQSMGTIGGGNHFCELQAIEEVFEPYVLEHLNIDKGQALLFVHSGSRGFGMSVFQTVEHCFADGLRADSTELEVYLHLHDGAVVGHR